MNNTELKTAILEFIRKNNGSSEGEVLRAMFPEPAFPVNGDEDQITAWRVANESWKDAVYGITGVAYLETYAGRCSHATIELRTEGHIRTVNNGYNCYSYFPVNRQSNERRKQVRRDRTACYAELGMHKVLGALGGTYYE